MTLWRLFGGLLLCIPAIGCLQDVPCADRDFAATVQQTQVGAYPTYRTDVVLNDTFLSFLLTENPRPGGFGSSVWTDDELRRLLKRAPWYNASRSYRVSEEVVRSFGSSDRTALCPAVTQLHAGPAQHGVRCEDGTDTAAALRVRGEWRQVVETCGGGPAEFQTLKATVQALRARA